MKSTQTYYYYPKLMRRKVPEKPPQPPVAIRNPIILNNQMRIITVADFARICRTCLKEVPNLRPIVNVLIDETKAVDLLEQTIGLGFKTDDELPPNICDNCLSQLYQMDRFKKQCLENVNNMKLLVEQVQANKPNLDESVHDFPSPKFSAITRQHRRCPYCYKIFLKEHFEAHFKSHSQDCMCKCDVCGQCFTKNSLLRKHKVEHEEGHVYICEKCGEQFVQSSVFRKHLETHEPVEQFGNTDLIANGFQCDFCGKLFQRFVSYEKHVRNHTETDDGNSVEKELTCDLCPKTFSSKMHVRTHQNSVHGEKKYLCSECGKGFITKTTFKKHMRTHTGEKPYTCKVCNKSFSLLNTLYSHTYRHTGLKPYKCDQCGKDFRQTHQLRLHKRTHSGEKPYKCIFCNRKFSIKGNLRVHVRTHTGETPYVCDVCGKGFYESGSLKKHQKRHEQSEHSDAANVTE